MGHWGVREPTRSTRRPTSLDAAFEQVHGDRYDQLMDDRNPLSVDQVHKTLANPATLAAARRPPGRVWRRPGHLGRGRPPGLGGRRRPARRVQGSPPARGPRPAPSTGSATRTSTGTRPRCAASAARPRSSSSNVPAGPDVTDAERTAIYIGQLSERSAPPVLFRPESRHERTRGRSPRSGSSTPARPPSGNHGDPGTLSRPILAALALGLLGLLLSLCLLLYGLASIRGPSMFALLAAPCPGRHEVGPATAGTRFEAGPRPAEGPLKAYPRRSGMGPRSRIS